MTSPLPKNKLESLLQPNIPTSFLLAGIEWRVIFVDELVELGLTLRDVATIKLRSGMPAQIAEATFYHELIHAILYATGKTEHDERDVDAIGAFLHQFTVTRK